MSADQLSRDELRRYQRHLTLPEFGEKGQHALKNARVLIVGVGGLGSPAALYLAAAGIGTLGLVDADIVDISNLQRQILYGTASIGSGKLSEARKRLHDVNPHVNIIEHETFLSSTNALEIIAGYDIVIDGTDNFPTRYLVNDACVLLHKPNVYGSIFRFDGQVSVFDADRGPCYRCLYDEPPEPGAVPSCAEAGVLGVLPGIVGVMQATEAIKLLCGIGEPLIGRLVLYDALSMRFHELSIPKNPACPICGVNPRITALIDYDEFCGVPKLSDKSMNNVSTEIISIDDLHRLIDSNSDVALLDVREPFEAEISSLGGTLVPLGTLANHIHELPRDQDWVVYCHSGMRSAQAVEFLRAQGFPRVRNLQGGISAWMKKYSLPSNID